MSEIKNSIFQNKNPKFTYFYQNLLSIVHLFIQILYLLQNYDKNTQKIYNFFNLQDKEIQLPTNVKSHTVQYFTLQILDYCQGKSTRSSAFIEKQCLHQGFQNPWSFYFSDCCELSDILQREFVLVILYSHDLIKLAKLQN